MTTVLDRILTEIRQADGTVTLGVLARRMDTAVSALAPMIRTLEAAGLLDAEAGPTAACSTGCGGTCHPSVCPLTVSLPTPLAVVGLETTAPGSGP